MILFLGTDLLAPDPKSLFVPYSSRLGMAEARKRRTAWAGAKPVESVEFASEHDTAVIRCLADLLANDQPLQLDPLAVRRAHLPQPLGGLGPRSVTAGRCAAYSAFWADTFPVLHRRRPHHRDDNIAVQSASIAAFARASLLREQGFAPPPWATVALGGRAAPHCGLREFQGGA